MSDDAIAGNLWTINVVAVAVGAGLAGFPRSRFRSVLIWSWCLAPVILAVCVMAALILQSDYNAAFYATYFPLLLTIALPLWSGLVLTPYEIIRRWREMRNEINGRSD
ncbi:MULTISPECIES: hypothetical protein [unclassified Sphingomonas]|uniref:hypothetical protein n=1 Tax=unclassified Sphingomonas TaxID=196159 RepID=UPI001045823C|nr:MULTISPECIES: hypothetical protein [unclassified Sphingomonas]